MKCVTHQNVARVALNQRNGTFRSFYFVLSDLELTLKEIQTPKAPHHAVQSQGGTERDGRGGSTGPAQQTQAICRPAPTSPSVYWPCRSPDVMHGLLRLSGCLQNANFPRASGRDKQGQGWGPAGPLTESISAVLHLPLVKVSAHEPDLGAASRTDNWPFPLSYSRFSLQNEPAWDPDSSIYN